MGTVVSILQKRKLRCREVTQGQVSEVVVGSQTKVFQTLNLALLLHHTAFQPRDTFWLLKVDSVIYAQHRSSISFSFFLNELWTQKGKHSVYWLTAMLLGCLSLFSYPPSKVWFKFLSSPWRLEWLLFGSSMYVSFSEFLQHEQFVLEIIAHHLVFYTFHTCTFFFIKWIIN